MSEKKYKIDDSVYIVENNEVITNVVVSHILKTKNGVYLSFINNNSYYNINDVYLTKKCALDFIIDTETKKYNKKIDEINQINS